MTYQKSLENLVERNDDLVERLNFILSAVDGMTHDKTIKDYIYDIQWDFNDQSAAFEDLKQTYENALSEQHEYERRQFRKLAIKIDFDAYRSYELLKDKYPDRETFADGDLVNCLIEILEERTGQDTYEYMVFRYIKRLLSLDSIIYRLTGFTLGDDDVCINSDQLELLRKLFVKKVEADNDDENNSDK
ncbi:hypothetical protein [Aerococcus sp. Group 1]|uniref:hypothetical protein n=1 Tax=Aerococcus urinae (strain CCUG 59500 / ACS-120-V-Col10a) TaxID=2976812 RepID=UPI00227A7F76|nr:hypothetical protein [Aerococcus sp. Group 1]MCY3031366.1 hypothetical protein [Aerococcus sp. Group 1]